MGDRANIYLVDTTDASHGIYLYTHYEGYNWPERLREALVLGADRWGDEQYLARVIVSHVFANLDGNTGGGVSTVIGDNAYPIIVVDLLNDEVAFASEGSEGNRSAWKNTTAFTDYVQNEADYPDDL